MSEQSTRSRLTDSQSVTTVSIDPTASRSGWRPMQLAGVILILVGATFLLANLGLLWWWSWGTMWPIIVIGIGLYILAKNVDARVGK